MAQHPSAKSEGLRLFPHGDSEFFLRPTLVTRQKTSFSLSFSTIRTYLDRESAEAIIHAFVATNLDYCNAILHGLPKALLNRLQLVQNRAARIVTFTKKYEHITPILIDLHWLPVEYRITYKILLLVYKAINGLSPSYISNLLSFVSAPTLCVLVRISYFKSRDLSLSLMVIEDFLLQDLNYGTAYPHL